MSADNRIINLVDAKLKQFKEESCLLAFYDIFKHINKRKKQTQNRAKL